LALGYGLLLAWGRSLHNERKMYEMDKADFERNRIAKEKKLQEEKLAVKMEKAELMNARAVVVDQQEQLQAQAELLEEEADKMMQHVIGQDFTTIPEGERVWSRKLFNRLDVKAFSIAKVALDKRWNELEEWETSSLEVLKRRKREQEEMLQQRRERRQERVQVNKDELEDERDNLRRLTQELEALKMDMAEFNEESKRKEEEKLNELSNRMQVLDQREANLTLREDTAFRMQDVRGPQISYHPYSVNDDAKTQDDQQDGEEYVRIGVEEEDDEERMYEQLSTIEEAPEDEGSRSSRGLISIEDDVDHLSRDGTDRILDHGMIPSLSETTVEMEGNKMNALTTNKEEERVAESSKDEPSSVEKSLTDEDSNSEFDNTHTDKNCTPMLLKPPAIAMGSTNEESISSDTLNVTLLSTGKTDLKFETIHTADVSPAEGTVVAIVSTEENNNAVENVVLNDDADPKKENDDAAAATDDDDDASLSGSDVVEVATVSEEKSKMGDRSDDAVNDVSGCDADSITVQSVAPGQSDEETRFPTIDAVGVDLIGVIRRPVAGVGNELIEPANTDKAVIDTIREMNEVFGDADDDRDEVEDNATVAIKNALDAHCHDDKRDDSEVHSSCDTDIDDDDDDDDAEDAEINDDYEMQYCDESSITNTSIVMDDIENGVGVEIVVGIVSGRDANAVSQQ
jgi:hypothetical protein